MHLFAEWPVTPQGNLVPVQVEVPDLAHLMKLLAKDYNLRMVEAKQDGKTGFRDQHGKFYLYRHCHNPLELGLFLQEVGIDEETMEAMLGINQGMH